MVKEFPKGKEWLLDNSALRVSLDMTFDVPEEIAEQLELWGLNIFETCEYPGRHLPPQGGTWEPLAWLPD